MVPVAYAVGADALVRRDDRARPLAARLAGAYRTLAARGAFGPPPACHAAIVAALDAWGR